jgi:hypothetical protein
MADTNLKDVLNWVKATLQPALWAILLVGAVIWYSAESFVDNKVRAVLGPDIGKLHETLEEFDTRREEAIKRMTAMEVRLEEIGDRLDRMSSRVEPAAIPLGRSPARAVTPNQAVGRP